MRASSKRMDNLDDFEYRVVSEEHPVEEERSMRAERALPVTYTTLKDAIAGIPALIEDNVVAFVIQEDYNGARRRITDYMSCYRALSTGRSTKN